LWRGGALRRTGLSASSDKLGFFVRLAPAVFPGPVSFGLSVHLAKFQNGEHEPSRSQKGDESAEKKNYPFHFYLLPHRFHLEVIADGEDRGNPQPDKNSRFFVNRSEKPKPQRYREEE